MKKQSIRELLKSDIKNKKARRKRIAKEVEKVISSTEEVILSTEDVREKGEPLHRTSGAKTHSMAEIAAYCTQHNLEFVRWEEIDLWMKIPVYRPSSIKT